MEHEEPKEARQPFQFEKVFELERPRLSETLSEPVVSKKPARKTVSKKFLVVWVLAAAVLLGGLTLFRRKPKIEPMVALTETIRLSTSILPKANAKQINVAIALRLVRAKQWVPAKRIFEDILISEPTNASILNNLAYVAGEQGDLTKAADYLSTAIQVSSTCAECFNNLGSILFKQGKAEEAKKMFERALAVDPKYADAELNISVALESLSDWLAAAEHYQRATSLVKDPEVIKWIAQRATWMAEIAGTTAIPAAAPASAKPSGRSKRDVAGEK